MISIGTVLKGMELKSSEVAVSLQVACAAIAASRGAVALGVAPTVNPIFVVPGSQGVVEFSGFKAGRFSKKDKLFAVLIEVPKSMVSSKQSPAFIVQALEEAVRLAEAKFSSIGELFDRSTASEHIHAVTVALAAPAQQGIQADAASPRRLT